MAQIFDSLFEAQTLTAAINAIDITPTLLQGVFEEAGITTTEASIERRADALGLVPAVPRGAPGRPYAMAKRDALTFKAVHLPQRATILADALQNVRAFGQDGIYTVEQRRNEQLAIMRADLDNTLEHQRVGALMGQVLNADGSVLYDLLTEFSVSQQTHAMAIATATTKIRTKFVEARRKAEAALGNLRPKSWLCLAGAQFFDGVSDHPSVEAFLAAQPAASELRGDNRAGFEIGGVMVTEYSFGTAGVPWIDTDEAYLVPVGAPGLLIGRYAPADYANTINTIGIPYYSSGEPLPHNKGISLEAQSNPIFLCTRPRAVIKLTA
jgi:major capsid protein E